MGVKASSKIKSVKAECITLIVNLFLIPYIEKSVFIVQALYWTEQIGLAFDAFSAVI